MTPTIRVDEDVFAGLQSLAKPFTDTPNTVIRRMLEERGALQKPRSKQSSSDTGAITPQAEYEKFLLQVLATRFKGSGAKPEVTAAVLSEMQTRGLLGPADMERVSTGESKAANTTAWARNALKDRGLISRTSPRGIWELTPKGLKEGLAIVL